MHKKISMYTFLLLLLISFFLPIYLQAQINEKVYSTYHRIDPHKKGELNIEIDNLNFFKNNEFAGDVMAGYSLPGLWIQPKVVFYPLENLKLELGLHALIYHGTYKYPSFAYIDIAKWKGNQYQKGSHLLPYLRAQADLSDHWTLVFGNIYGGANHSLIEPLYNPELNYTADPEVGLQLIYDTPKFKTDLWLNWQSFIFDLDTHQEAFTVGLSSRFRFNPSDARVHFYMPLQFLAQHRGGEIDTLTVGSVQTLMNGAIGAGVKWNTGHRMFRNFCVEYNFAGYYQQAGKIWPFNSGYANYLNASADIGDFRVKAAYWECYDFISMYGLPYFGAVSSKTNGLTFKDPQLIQLGAEYSRNLGKGFSLGVDFDLYYHLSGEKKHPEKGKLPSQNSASFTFGACLRFNPSILIKKY